MAYTLEYINARAKADPASFIHDCDRDYEKRISAAAEKIANNLEKSPVVLLSGPSGSGKTTTAMKLRDRLKAMDISSHSISLDNYFKPMLREHLPKTPEGEPDFESPDYLDTDLLCAHIKMLAAGEKIFVPHYEFSRRMRIFEPKDMLCLGEHEVVIFEGIHALNDRITGECPDAFTLYVSAHSNVATKDGSYVFYGKWMRLVRRVVRDHLFRGADPAETMEMWANVRRGEHAYIDPFKGKADVGIDTTFAYEVCVLKTAAAELFARVPEGIGRREEILQVGPAMEAFSAIDARLLAPDAMLREFLGGGIYDY